ncbi:MAG: hypothetical protein IJ719_17530 [Clostridia bacterium]|nr:hypothetical protein [Clostridia bacterium]
MNLLEHIADHLDFEGLGILNTDEQEGDIFWGILPEDLPANAERSISVMSTDSSYGGSPSGARIQIFTRGGIGDVRTSYELACEITRVLEGFNGYLHGDGPHVRVEVLSSAQGSGLDTSGRHYYVSNYKFYYCDFMED